MVVSGNLFFFFFIKCKFESAWNLKWMMSINLTIWRGGGGGVEEVMGRGKKGGGRRGASRSAYMIFSPVWTLGALPVSVFTFMSGSTKEIFHRKWESLVESSWPDLTWPDLLCRLWRALTSWCMCVRPTLPPPCGVKPKKPFSLWVSVST